MRFPFFPLGKFFPDLKSTPNALADYVGDYLRANGMRDRPARNICNFVAALQGAYLSTLHANGELEKDNNFLRFLSDVRSQHIDELNDAFKRTVETYQATIDDLRKGKKHV